MLSSSRALAGAISLVAFVAAGCSTRTTAPFPAAITAPAGVQTASAPVPAPEPVRQADPATELIAVSTLHFEAGQRELELGHLDSAKEQFNRALEVLLESTFGGRTEPRIRDHFDQLVERISAYEVTALAQGDGFAEQRYESATIDQILAVSTFEIPPPSAETTQTVTADLQAIVHDIDIPLNAKVLSFVQLFTGRLKSYLEEGLSRGMQFLPMIQDVFRAEGLPLDLAYIPLVESAFKPSALSRAKARGMWQFMRGTALENGLTHDWYIDERAEPEKATRAAAKYLKTLNGMFDGDWHLALASYNGGPGRVQRAMKSSGRLDFWNLSATTRYLPRETRDYVPLILAAIIIARNPAQYGMNVQPLEQPPAESVTLSAAVDLRRIAEWLGTPVQVIQDLNPELRRWTTPVRATDYELKVPERHRRHHPGSPRSKRSRRTGAAELAHREKGRDARHDRQEAEGKPDGSGGGELPVHARQGGDRPAADYSPRSGPADRAHRQPGARHGITPGRPGPLQQHGSQGRRAGSGVAHLPRQARRHPVLDCQAVSDDGGVAQDVEPPAEQLNPGGSAADDLHPAHRDRDELASYAN